MNKKILALIPILLTVTAALAASTTIQLNLVAKDPSTWQPIVGGAWGRMNINKDNFVFNGHGLIAGATYTLISYKEPWGATPGILGTGVADATGNVHVSGDTANLVCNVYAADASGDYKGVSGAKVWLVDSTFPSWNPTGWLFETALIPMTC